MVDKSHSGRRYEYIDFSVEIRESGDRNRYVVAVSSPEGQVQEETRLPFNEWELKDKLRDVEVALLRSMGLRRRIGTPEEQTIQGFGQALFETMFVGQVDTQYRMNLREAKRQNKGLRLKLHVRPPELSTLPWEFVYDPKGNYLTLSSRTPLVRYPDVPQPIERLTVTPPLSILGLVASPQGLPELDVGKEKRLVEEAVKELEAEGLVKLTWLGGQTWYDLRRAMRRGQWHVFHFIGHGGFDPETEEGALALSDEDGRKHLLGATDLALLLDDHDPLRLVFLNSCDGAKGSPRDTFSSTASALVRSGIPAVVAMQYEITDKAAIDFSRAFYEALADGLPVDAAVVEARTAVKMTSALEWGTPVLYMRSTDGRIFDLEEDPARTYREHVKAIWENGKLNEGEVQQLREHASSAGLSPSIAADIERRVMGDTKEAILERQNKLSELYTRARRSHRNQEWQAVVDLFAEIHALDPAYPDPEGLLVSAHEGLADRPETPPPPPPPTPPPPPLLRRLFAALRRRKRAAGGILAVLVLAALLGVIFIPDPTVVPDVVGQTKSEAEQSAKQEGYKIDFDSVRVDRQPKGNIIAQDPEAGESAERGSSISSVVSAGQPPDPGDIFIDEFKRTNTGWPHGEYRKNTDYYYVSRYFHGVYRIENPPPASIAESLHYDVGTQEDMIVEVNAEVTGNTPAGEDSWGIICRAEDYDNYYLLEIGPGGNSAIWKLQKGKWNDLAYGARSDAIRGGTQNNHLRADCLGNKLTLFVNGQKVVEAEDSTFGSGVAGLAVEDSGDQKLEVLFDEFLVSSP